MKQLDWWPCSDEASPPLPAISIPSLPSPPLLSLRPPNVFWRILGVNLIIIDCLTMKHLLCHYFHVVENK